MNKAERISKALKFLGRNGYVLHATSPKRGIKHKTADEVLKRLTDKADKSSRHFIAELGNAIIAIPKIKGRTQEEADADCYTILDGLFSSFVKAQTDAIKAGVCQAVMQLTEASTKEEK